MKKTQLMMTFRLEEFGNKIKFKSDKEFVFSYSLYDNADEYFSDNDDWKKERKELNNLEITGVSDKSSKSNIVLINFRRNYIKSSTKYTIVIVASSEKNTKENLSNPCYLVKLITDGKEKVKVQNFFNPGLDDILTAEVDIEEILDKDKYIVSIISQELRYGKQFRFYTPFEFAHKKKGISKLLLIILPIVGAVVLILIIVLIIVCCIKRKKASDNSMPEEKILCED